MIRRIVVLLAGTPCDAKAASAAIAIGKRLGAAVEGLAIKVDPSELMFRLGEGVAASAIDTIIEAAERTSEEAAGRARETLEAAAKSANVSIISSPGEVPGASAHFYAVQGPAIDVLTSETSFADLVVFGEPGDGAPIDYPIKIEHTLMALRRPILIARGNVSSDLGAKILVSFNGTIEACNAIKDSVSLIAKAKAVEILHLKEQEVDAGIGDVAVRYIKQHGGSATVHEEAPTGKGIGPEIAERANAVGADLIVMGGYGRSRLREMILGGATRHMIYHGVLPVLLAH